MDVNIVCNTVHLKWLADNIVKNVWNNNQWNERKKW